MKKLMGKQFSFDVPVFVESPFYSSRYREQDKNIFKIVDACALKNGEKLSSTKLHEIGTLPGLPFNNDVEIPNTSSNAFDVSEPILSDFAGQSTNF
jgi:hypothetical protein